MDKQPEQAKRWEMALVDVAQRQLQYLRELDADRSGETEKSDVHGALSGLCALTDLAYEESFDFSEAARAALLQINEESMAVMRERAARPHPHVRELGSPDEEAAVALYDAILMNLPNLAAGESSGHALALSKALYQTIAEHCGERPGFDAASSVICIQDYRAMLLAGRPTSKL
ncbi:hypothetical protein [Pseudomonas amygdali]|uniref:hypothetical protein n=1 Tax=Pseudomonas amygdali TaxID=47877 RepID=UPI0006B9020D|nr:hypothetical protein [Pseudomonas amygdali]PPS24383.1 hypothetical protein BVY10_25200 [Pseudomonas amygdali pv. morsprunorum]